MSAVAKAEFCQKYDISSHTLNAWLNNSRQLSHKGADKIAQAFSQEGWFVSPEWLMAGQGFAPTYVERSHFYNFSQTRSVNADRFKEEDFMIAKEVAFFRNANPSALLLIIANAEMVPQFDIGDYIGGVPIDKELYDKVIGQVCIVDVKNVNRGAYRLHQGDQEGQFTLSVLNMRATGSPSIIANITPMLVAPVIWHRKSLKSLILPEV